MMKPLTDAGKFAAGEVVGGAKFAAGTTGRIANNLSGGRLEQGPAALKAAAKAAEQKAIIVAHRVADAKAAADEQAAVVQARIDRAAAKMDAKTGGRMSAAKAAIDKSAATAAEKVAAKAKLAADAAAERVKSGVAEIENAVVGEPLEEQEMFEEGAAADEAGAGDNLPQGGGDEGGVAAGGGAGGGASGDTAPAADAGDAAPAAPPAETSGAAGTAAPEAPAATSTLEVSGNKSKYEHLHRLLEQTVGRERRRRQEFFRESAFPSLDAATTEAARNVANAASNVAEQAAEAPARVGAEAAGDATLQAAEAAGVGAEAQQAANAAGDAAGQVAGAAGQAADAGTSVVDAVGGAPGRAAGAVGDAVGGAVGDAAGAVGDAAGQAAGAVADTASKTATALKDAVAVSEFERVRAEETQKALEEQRAEALAQTTEKLDAASEAVQKNAVQGLVNTREGIKKGVNLAGEKLDEAGEYLDKKLGVSEKVENAKKLPGIAKALAEEKANQAALYGQAKYLQAKNVAGAAGEEVMGAAKKGFDKLFGPDKVPEVPPPANINMLRFAREQMILKNFTNERCPELAVRDFNKLKLEWAGGKRTLAERISDAVGDICERDSRTCEWRMAKLGDFTPAGRELFCAMIATKGEQVNTHRRGGRPTGYVQRKGLLVVNPLRPSIFSSPFFPAKLFFHHARNTPVCLLGRRSGWRGSSCHCQEVDK